MAEDLFETPLFPLHVVLVPGMALPLHIFEPRYREMTRACLDSEKQVGIVLALPEGAVGREMPARVGTLARIADYERLPDGRYNLLAVGTQRFEILEVRHDHPYLTGLVRALNDRDDRDERGDVDALARDARAALDAYLRLVLTLVGSEERHIAIPTDPDELSYVIAMCLACEDTEKQRFLEMTSLAQRLRTGIALLRDETAVLADQAENIFHRPRDEPRSNLN